MFWDGCCVDSCSAAGAPGRAFWRCIFGWLLAMPTLYHHYGLQGRRSWPQDGSNAAVRQPTWRLFFAMGELQGYWGERFGGTCLDDLSLRRACRATVESVLEEFLCFGVVAALILARLQGHWGQRFGGVFLDGFWQCQCCITIIGPKVDEVGLKM